MEHQDPAGGTAIDDDRQPQQERRAQPLDSQAARSRRSGNDSGHRELSTRPGNGIQSIADRDEERFMRNSLVYGVVLLAVLSAGVATARAQNQAGRGGAGRGAAPAPPSGPAPVRDLSGVWSQKRNATGINVGNLNTW